ncbi:MAG TPA: hypothetical protein ACFYED_00055 [Candidatus Tripitaka californicus]|uniref:hypothetical protein n=1 Tax=Candidatus Tripitaka californicus TaxID=3367616 RepID=UPI004026CD21
MQHIADMSYEWLTIDAHQDCAPYMRAAGAAIRQLKYGDYSFNTLDALPVLVEEKKLHDLITSWRARRLQRQLRKLLQENPAGANVLALRAAGAVPTLAETLWTEIPTELYLDLLRWQLLGGVVAFMPYAPQAVLETLTDWRACMRPGRALLSILAGDDRPQRQQQEQLTDTAYALMKLCKGVGRATAASWAQAANQSLNTAINMDEQLLKQAGVRKGAREWLQSVL